MTDATLPSLKTLPPALQAVRPMDRLDSLGESPTLLLDGTRYFAVPLRTSLGPGGRLAPGALPRDQLATGEMGGGTPPLALGSARSASWRPSRAGSPTASAGGFAGSSSRWRESPPATSRDSSRDLRATRSRTSPVRFNRMCNQLKQMQQTIRQSERTRLLAQLAAGLAHQLRNSLTGARMSVQLHARRFPPQDGDETLDVALRQLAMTEEQVKGLLSLGRVERQPHAPCELGQLLEDVALLVKPSCQHAKVELCRHRAGDDPLHVMADEAGLRAAVLNLTMNAIEAAGPAARSISAHRADRGEVTIEVSDTGPGPPPEVAEHLLEPFVTSKPEGVGLGLAVAQQVAVEHGGRLTW